MRVPAVPLVSCLALAQLSPALVFPQSLGDAARRQSTTRAERSSTARLYTDSDLRSGASALPRPGADPTAVEALSPPSRPREEGAEAQAAAPFAPGPAVESEDAIRARLDREAEERRQREIEWRGLARSARVRVESAQRAHDTACGPGALVFTGG